jgi:DNA-binding Lrp family transcriptional regulator
VTLTLDRSEGGDPGRNESSRQKLNGELIRMALCLAKTGPNVNEIARVTSCHKETVRYRYHRFFRERGITIQAMPNYAKLGFKRLILVLKLAPSFEHIAKDVFTALSGFCYLHSYTRVLLRGTYLVHVAVPRELADRCARVYMDLQRAGLFVELEILAFEEMRNPPMKPDRFDFVRSSWSVDWNFIKPSGPGLPLTAVRGPDKYDRVDLLILKELEKDAGRTLVKMVSNLNVSLNALEFHRREHVEARGLIKGYRLVWQGTRYDFEQQRAVSRKDYLELTILLEGGTRDEVTELTMLLNSTPFLWSEAYGEAYCAEIFVPTYEFAGLLAYLDRFVSKVCEKLRIFTMDQNQAVRFVIAYDLFDAESRKWQLDSRLVMRTMRRLAPSIGDT